VVDDAGHAADARAACALLRGRSRGADDGCAPAPTGVRGA
jgi:hypothetical protein